MEGRERGRRKVGRERGWRVEREGGVGRWREEEGGNELYLVGRNREKVCKETSNGF